MFDSISKESLDIPVWRLYENPWRDFFAYFFIDGKVSGTAVERLNVTMTPRQVYQELNIPSAEKEACK